ncbi:MAG: L,D-transpeptidase [Gemmatimonadaceae bacterium]
MYRAIVREPRLGAAKPATHLRPPLIAILAILVGLALCGYPRPVVSTQADSAQQPQTLSLELNIPAFRLDVRDGSILVRSFPVAVGMRRYKTPTGDFEITRIVWNPWWFPPDAEWAANDTVTPPGPTNPMGKVKLMFNGPYYLHGTPLASSIGRAASHGCVRLRNEDAVELARIVQKQGGVEVTESLMDSLATAWTKTRLFELASFIPVTIVYRTAEVRDSMFSLYPDVYRRLRDTPYDRALAALNAAGIDSSAVDTHAVRRLARRAVRLMVSVPLEQVLVLAVAGGLEP